MLTYDHLLGGYYNSLYGMCQDIVMTQYMYIINGLSMCHHLHVVKYLGSLVGGTQSAPHAPYQSLAIMLRSGFASCLPFPHRPK